MKPPVFAFLVVFLSVFAVGLRAAEPPSPKPMRAAKVLFLGNSITRHAPKPEIGWTADWGMAASAMEKDYVHLLAADLGRAAGMVPQIMVSNVADFERRYDRFDLEAELKAELAFGADLVVVAVGENVADPVEAGDREKFAAAFSGLLGVLRKHGQPAIFVRSSFWPHPVKDGIMKKASVDAGVTFVDISGWAGAGPLTAGSERKIEHAGVAGHPGDKGMKAIAEALFAAIQKAPATR
jgi:lysophospholipase L1-like esterase